MSERRQRSSRREGSGLQYQPFTPKEGMMDERRLDTGRQVPETDVPEDRETVDAEDDESWSYIGDERVVEALEAGKLVSASNYHGIPYAWKAADGVYRGTLLRYRAVTENPTFATAEDAAEWFGETYHATYG